MRKYPDRPIVGVGAVIVDVDRVVLVKRGHDPLKGEWSLPGGSVEVGETLAEALVRVHSVGIKPAGRSIARDAD